MRSSSRFLRRRPRWRSCSTCRRRRSFWARRTADQVSADGRSYDYAIAARTIAAADLDEAVYAVSGYSAEELRAVLHEGEGRCSFGWYAPETDGGRLYHAEILSDRDYYYALIFDVREDAGTTYHSTEEQVFASFGLIS